MTQIYIVRTGQAMDLRRFAIGKLGCETVAMMSDSDISGWLQAEGYQSYIEYTGAYDDSDEILLAKENAIQRLVDGGDAFWATR